MKKSEAIGAYLAIGAGIGVALGAAMDNIGVGVAIGVAVGMAIGASRGHGDAGDGESAAGEEEEE